MDQELLKMGQEGLKIVFWTKETPFLSKKNKQFVKIGLGACRQCYRATMNCATGGPKDILAFSFFYLVMTLMI